MDYDVVENSLQAVFAQTLPLSRSQLGRLSQLSIGLMLAGETVMPKIARQLTVATRQDSRVRWIERLLEAPFMTQEHIYPAWIMQLLKSYQSPTLHLAMDRTDVVDHVYDLVSMNLVFRHRAIPLVWQLRPTGMTGAITHRYLLNRCCALIRPDRQVIFHGDNEFGSVEVMRWLRTHGWDFIVGQAAKNYYRHSATSPARQLCELPVTPTRPVYREHVDLTRAHWFEGVNLFAFYQPVYHRNRRKQAVRYYATSLPITPTLRRIGKRRWGIECFFKDLKSAGWHLPLSQIRHTKRLQGLLIVLNLVYTWTTCLGRWLCKTSQRSYIDSQPQRHLSLFRLGWDWLVHTIRRDALCPALTTLYS
jgi:Transposase DDE domain